MSKKVRNIIWIILLILCSFPTGYFYLYTDNSNEFALHHWSFSFITAGALLSLIGIVISSISYFYHRYKKSNDPAKKALTYYTLLLVVGLTKSLYQYYSDDTKKESNDAAVNYTRGNGVVYIGSKSIFSIPVNINPSELEERGFEMKKEEGTLMGKPWWSGHIDNENYYASVTCIEDSSFKMTNFFINIQANAFYKMTKLESDSYDSVKIDDMLFEIKRNYPQHGVLRVRRLGLGF